VQVRALVQGQLIRAAHMQDANAELSAVVRQSEHNSFLSDAVHIGLIVNLPVVGMQQLQHCRLSYQHSKRSALRCNVLTKRCQERCTNCGNSSHAMPLLLLALVQVVAPAAVTVATTADVLLSVVHASAECQCLTLL
jgi:hypothetical protein